MLGIILGVVIVLFTLYLVRLYNKNWSPFKKYDKFSELPTRHKWVIGIALVGALVALYCQGDIMLSIMIEGPNYLLHTLIYIACIISIDFIVLLRRKYKWIVILAVPYVYIAAFTLTSILSGFILP